MPVRKSPFFNDPAFAQAASNLAGLFEAPSGADAAGWATANATREKASRLAQLFANPNDPNFDRQNVAVGNYSPLQSYYAQDQNNATTQRGQDLTASTARYGADRTYDASTENNAADNVTAVRGQNVTANTALATNRLDNQRATITDLYSPLNPGQVQPAVPAEVAKLLGLPAIAQANGIAPTLSLDQVKAAEREDLRKRGLLTDQDLIDTIAGAETPVQIVGPDNKPQYSTPGAAVRSGAQPFINKGAEAKPDIVNYQAPDGKTQGTAYFNGTTMVDTQTNAPIPSGSQTYKAQTTGGVGDVLGVKTTEAQDKNAYAATMADGATVDILKSFDTPGALPTGTDFQVFNAMRNLPTAAQPALVGQMTPQGQNFYQNLRIALPFQLMSQSGQAVTEQEYERKMLELMPIPGEDPGVTMSKRRQFETYIKAARGVAGPAYDKIHLRGQIPQERPQPAQPITSPTSGVLEFDENGNPVQ